jgi:hypothetical protein
MGGVTDAVLRQQQMDTQRELIGSAEEAAAQTREGLPGLRVADPNLNIQFDPATAPVGGPNLLATGDVQYDPEYFKYETDLQQVMLDALRQNLMGEGGVDPQTAAQMADLQDRQARDEAQTTEDLQRLGVLRGGGDTADVLGELRSGYGRTYSDILSDQAYRQQNDPRLEAALELAQLGSDRYMTGGEMVGRLGGQDTLEARLANQQAIEREADISGFLRGARSLEGRGQDIDAQFGRADRQLEQARVLAPQYESAADLARSDAMLQQDLADRNLARGLTITEPTTRERFEEGVRGAQEAESLARAGVTGYLDDQATLARELGLDLERERDLTAAREADRDRMLERELAAGEVSLDGASRGRTTTIAGQEAGAAERMQTEQLGSEERRLGDQLDTDEALARIDAKSRTDIQSLINQGSYDEAEMLMGLERDMQNERLTFEQQNLFKELKNAVTLGQIDMFGAQDLQRIINEGNLGQANTVLEGIKATATATVDVAKEQRGAAKDVAQLDKETQEALAAIDQEMQTERVGAQSKDLLETLKNALELGELDAATAKSIQRTISRGEFSVAQTQLAGIRAQADATVDVAKEQRAGATELKQIDEAIANARIGSEEKVLLEELKTQIELGTISADAAKAVQRTISQGNFNVALTQLEGTKADAAAAVDVAVEQRGAAVDVEKERSAGAKAIAEIDERIASERVGSEEKVLLEELKTQIELGNITAAQAVDVQKEISSGNLAVAEEQLEGIREQTKATVDVAKEQRGAAVDVEKERSAGAKAIAEIDERIASERVGSEEKVLLEELKTQIELGNITATQAVDVQKEINSGNFAEVQEQLSYAREIAAGSVTIDGEERETLDAAQRREDNEYRDGIATGEIGGKQTVDYLLADRAADVNQQRADLETDLANLEITKYLGDRQAQSLADLLALVSTLPEGDQRDSVMNRIGSQIETAALTGSAGQGSPFETMIAEIADTGTGNDAQTMRLLGYEWYPNNRGGGQWIHEDYVVNPS